MAGLSQSGQVLAAYPVYQTALPPNAQVSWANNDIIINRIQGKKIEKNRLLVPDYVKGELAPLLISGSTDHFKLLLFHNDNIAGQSGLVLADVKGNKRDWKEVEGDGGCLIAGAGAVLAFNGNKIYLSEPVMSTIDLLSQKLEVKEFTAANALRKSIAKNIELANLKHGEVYPAVQLGSYKDVVLMSIALPDEHWIWAFRSDKCIGSLYFNTEKKSIDICQVGAKSRTSRFASHVNGFILPAQGFGQYK